MIYGKYTIVLKTLLDDPKSKEAIDKALSTYPLYDAKNESNFTQVLSREELNKKILDHFKYREIGFETFGRWLDELEIAMNEIMPYYNQLFMSEDIINGIDDIFGNLNVKETFEEERTGTSEDSSETSETFENNINDSSSSESSSESTDNSTQVNQSETNGKNVKSDTPQSQLNISSNDIDNISYANEVNWNKDHANSNTRNEGSTTGTNETSSSSNREEDSTRNQTYSNNGSTSGTTKHTLTRIGNQGVNTYAHDMLEFRNLFINIAQQIINDSRIQELFMQVY